jgi:hypothetical protein
VGLINAVIIKIDIIIFFATIFRSAFGFGESIIAVPLLALFMPLEVAVPLSVFISVTIAGFVVVQDRNKIHFKSAGWLVVYAIIGIPFGLWLLTHVSEVWIKSILGTVIIAFSIYLLTGTKLKTLKEDHNGWLSGCGLLSGILGGAYGINGPPLVIYGAKRGWTAQHFRATLQAYFLVASLVGVLGYWYSNLITWVLLRYFLLTLPVLVPAILIGRYINSKMQGSQFFKYSYIVLLLLGLMLMVNVFVSK